MSLEEPPRSRPTIYIERGLTRVFLLTERQAQELIDHFIMKIAPVRFCARRSDSLFSGDPMVFEVIGGMGLLMAARW